MVNLLALYVAALSYEVTPWDCTRFGLPLLPQELHSYLPPHQSPARAVHMHLNDLYYEAKKRRDQPWEIAELHARCCCWDLLTDMSNTNKSPESRVLAGQALQWHIGPLAYYCGATP